MDKKFFMTTDPMGDFSKSKLKSDIDINTSHRIAKSLANKTDKNKDITFKDKVMYSALAGIAALAATKGYSKLLGRRFSVPSYLAAAASSGTTGYFAPEIANVIRRESRGEIGRDEAGKLIRSIDDPSRKVFKETKEISELYGGIGKEAGIATGLAKGIYKGVSGTTGALWKGMFPGKNPSIGRKALSYGVRGGIGVGALYGGYKGVKALTAERSGKNYTTFLRNQILAGNINQNELSQNDLISVRKLGMK